MRVFDKVEEQIVDPSRQLIYYFPALAKSSVGIETPFPTAA
jgi:hypothetical protein